VKQNTWGILYDFQGTMPDFYRDSEIDLFKKLKFFSSEHYLCNQEFAELLAEKAECQIRGGKVDGIS